MDTLNKESSEINTKPKKATPLSPQRRHGTVSLSSADLAQTRDSPQQSNSINEKRMSQLGLDSPVSSPSPTLQTSQSLNLNNSTNNSRPTTPVQTAVKKSLAVFAGLLKRQGYEDQAESEVVRLVTDCVAYLELRALHSEGVFRISGSVAQIKLLRKNYDRGRKIDLLVECRDVNTVAGLLKNYLDTLKEPLLTNNLYGDWLQVATFEFHEDKIKRLRSLLSQLPTGNLQTLKIVLGLASKVAAASETTKMPSENLARIFGPIFLKNTKSSREEQMKDLIPAANIAKTLIDEYESLFNASSSSNNMDGTKKTVSTTVKKTRRASATLKKGEFKRSNSAPQNNLDDEEQDNDEDEPPALPLRDSATSETNHVGGDDSEQVPTKPKKKVVKKPKTQPITADFVPRRTVSVDDDRLLSPAPTNSDGAPKKKKITPKKEPVGEDEIDFDDSEEDEVTRKRRTTIKFEQPQQETTTTTRPPIVVPAAGSTPLAPVVTKPKKKVGANGTTPKAKTLTPKEIRRITVTKTDSIDEFQHNSEETALPKKVVQKKKAATLSPKTAKSTLAKEVVAEKVEPIITPLVVPPTKKQTSKKSLVDVPIVEESEPVAVVKKATIKKSTSTTTTPTKVNSTSAQQATSVKTTPPKKNAVVEKEESNHNNVTPVKKKKPATSSPASPPPVNPTERELKERALSQKRIVRKAGGKPSASTETTPTKPEPVVLRAVTTAGSTTSTKKVIPKVNGNASNTTTQSSAKKNEGKSEATHKTIGRAAQKGTDFGRLQDTMDNLRKRQIEDFGIFLSVPEEVPDLFQQPEINFEEQSDEVLGGLLVHILSKRRLLNLTEDGLADLLSTLEVADTNAKVIFVRSNLEEITKPAQIRLFGELCEYLREIALIAGSEEEKLDENIALGSSIFAPLIFRLFEEGSKSPKSKRKVESTEQRLFQFVVKYSPQIFDS